MPTRAIGGPERDLSVQLSGWMLLEAAAAVDAPGAGPRRSSVSPVRVGVVILPQFSWPEARARWRSLEDRGFAHGWTYDHLAWRNLADQPWFGTIPTLTAAATATSTLRLGTWVASPNFRHPVTLAKDLMTLDDVSGGRVIAGVGAGGIGWDATVLGR